MTVIEAGIGLACSFVKAGNPEPRGRLSIGSAR